MTERTKADVQDMFIQAQKLLKEINIPISTEIAEDVVLKKRMSTAYGRCHAERNGQKFHFDNGLVTGYRYTIYLNENFALNGSYIAVKNTIIHELLHTIDIKSGHRGTWKRYAERVSRQLGMNVQRLNGDKTAEDRLLLKTTEQREKEAKTIIKLSCPTCGATWTYHKFTKVVRDAQDGDRYCHRCRMKYKAYDEHSRLVVEIHG